MFRKSTGKCPFDCQPKHRWPHQNARVSDKAARDKERDSNQPALVRSAARKIKA
jgi:hypothetical protein